MDAVRDSSRVGAQCLLRKFVACLLTACVDIAAVSTGSTSFYSACHISSFQHIMQEPGRIAKV